MNGQFLAAFVFVPSVFGQVSKSWKKLLAGK
jgi:hypothetical protein